MLAFGRTNSFEDALNTKGQPGSLPGQNLPDCAPARQPLLSPAPPRCASRLRCPGLHAPQTACCPRHLPVTWSSPTPPRGPVNICSPSDWLTPGASITTKHRVQTQDSLQPFVCWNTVPSALTLAPDIYSSGQRNRAQSEMLWPRVLDPAGKVHLHRDWGRPSTPACTPRGRGCTLPFQRQAGSLSTPQPALVYAAPCDQRGMRRGGAGRGLKSVCAAGCPPLL